MDKEFLRREKVAWIVALVAGSIATIALLLLAIVLVSYNETLVIISYNLAGLLFLIGGTALVLTAFAIGFRRAQDDGGLELLRYRSGKLAVVVIVGAFVIFAVSRGQVYQHEIKTGVRNADGSIVTQKR